MAKRSHTMFDSNTLNLHQPQSNLLSNLTNTLSNTLNTKSHSAKLIHVAVVGLSGTEKEKGCLGVGKSCLCNRFVRPSYDDYNYEHISVLSQTDFNSKIVRDHFLWWGEVTKFNESNYFNNSTLIGNSSNYINFSIIEETTFIDDTSFQPFNSGKLESYTKRIQNLKLHSSEKLMYICKNQLGIEKEYPQKYLPDGKFTVDGFVCCFDVSVIQGRTLDSAIEQTAIILNCLTKTKKPIVVATTKNDEANEFYVHEIERLLQRKEFRNYGIPIVETSAHENMNVEQVFFLLAQMIDKKVKCKPSLNFIESARLRKEHMDLVHKSYHSLITNRFFDPNLKWADCSQWICAQPEYAQYCEFFGSENCMKMFNKHIESLQDQLVNQKLQVYLKILPQVLALLLDENFEEEVITSNQLSGRITNADLNLSTLWNLTKMRLIEHPDFNNFFIINPNCSWREANLIQRSNDINETMIPFDLLETPEAEKCFNEFRNALKMNFKRHEMKLQFKQLLEETGFITPGKPLDEIRVLFMGRECYENLSEQNIIEIYQEHQQSLTERAKINFQELLLEHPDLFFAYASMNEIITQDDLIKIKKQIKDDMRFKALDNLEQERTFLLLKHLGFIHNPLKEHCPTYPQCIDILIEQTMALTSRKFSLSHANPIFRDDKYNQLNLIIIGLNQLAGELASLLKNTNLNFKKDHFRFSLDFRLINANFDVEEQSILQNSCSSNSFNHGCFCIYANALSLDYIQNCLEPTFLSNISENDLLFNGLPIIILFSPDFDLSEEEIEFLKEEGQNRAKRYQAIFLDVSNLQKHPESKYEEQLLNAMIDQMEHRAEFLNLINQSASSQQEMHQKFVKQMSTIEQDFPDLRILMCLLCGDIFPIEQVITPFLDHSLRTKNKIKVTSTSSFIVKVPINGSMKKVEFLLTSYHNAITYRDELLHGFFLVFSTMRKASLAALMSFTNNIPNTPTVIYGQQVDSNLLLLTDQHMYIDEDLTSKLIQKSSLFAKKINAHYALSSMFFDSKDNIDYNLDLFSEFFQEVEQRRPQIEKAFEIDVDQDYLKQQKNHPVSTKSSKKHQKDHTKPQVKAMATKKLPPLPMRQESLNLRKMDYQKHSVESLQKDFLDEEELDDEEDLNQDLSDEKLRVTEDDDDDRYEQLPILTEDINTKNNRVKQKPKYESELSATPSPPIITTSDSLDSEIYATIFNKDNENLLKPSQIKNRRQMQTDMLHKSYQSCESLDYVKQHSPQVPNLTKQHSPGQTKVSYTISPFSNYQQHQQSIKQNVTHQHKSQSRQQKSTTDQIINYGQSSVSTFQDPNYCKYSPNQSIRSSEVEKRSAGDIVLQTFRNESYKIRNLPSKQQSKDQSIYGTASRKYFAAERSQSMLDASHLQLKKHQNFVRQQQSIANELKEKQMFRQQQQHNVQQLPMYQVKNKNKPHEFSSDELSEEDDSPSSELSEPPEPAPIGLYEKQLTEGVCYPEKAKNKPGKLILKEFDNITNAVGRINLSKNYLPKMSDIEKSIDYSTTTTSSSNSTRFGQMKDSTYGYPLNQMKTSVENYTYQEQFSRKLNEDASDSESEDSSSEKPKRKSGSKKKSNLHPIDKYPVEKDHFEKQIRQMEFDDSILQSQEKLKSKPQEQQEAKKLTAAEKKKAKEESKAKKKAKIKSKDKRGSIIFAQSDDLPRDSIPLFMAKCICFIEENIDLEGLYRVPGNRCQVDYLFEKFNDDEPVNAVATALKEFVGKKLPNLLGNEFLEELRSLIDQEEPNKMRRLSQFKCLLNKLPTMNFNILKYLFQHFAKVAQNSRLNSIDSKNLAICWWPTLFAFEFTDMLMFESMRPSLEELVKSLIDEHEFVFTKS